MYCPKCGAENKEGARFCGNCGTPLAQKNMERSAEDGDAALSAGEREMGTPEKKKKKWPLILMIFLILAAACAVGGLLIFRQIERKQFQGYVKSGQKYLEEMNYEKAEDSYLAAIKVDPKQTEPYLRLADVYIAQGEEEKAEEILKQGADRTAAAEITERYSLYTYVEEVLIPEEGSCEEGEWICEYFNGEYIPCLESVDSLSGVLSSGIRDFDGDGREELLVLILRNEKTDWQFYEDYEKYNCNIVYLRMYEQEDGQVVLQDEERGIYPILGVGDYEEAGVFLTQNEGKTYICGSSANMVNLGLEGTELYSSFVMSYDGREFVRHAGYEQLVNYWSEEDLKSEETAEFLDSIGLADQAAYVRDMGVSAFDLRTEPGDMMMLATGENDGSGDNARFAQEVMDGRFNAELLGKVVYTLKLTWEDQTEEDTEQEESVPSSRLTEEEILDFLAGQTLKTPYSYSYEDFNGKGNYGIIALYTETDDFMSNTNCEVWYSNGRKSQLLFSWEDDIGNSHCVFHPELWYENTLGERYLVLNTTQRVALTFQECMIFGPDGTGKIGKIFEVEGSVDLEEETLLVTENVTDMTDFGPQTTSTSYYAEIFEGKLNAVQ